MRFSAVLLLLIFCFSIIQPSLPYIEYTVNYDYIATVLCINKEKPELACNGKCHLKSELSKSNNTSNSGPRRIPPIELEKYSFQGIDPLFENPFSTLSRVINTRDIPFVSNFLSKPPTPPPQC